MNNISYTSNPIHPTTPNATALRFASGASGPHDHNDLNDQRRIESDRRLPETQHELNEIFEMSDELTSKTETLLSIISIIQERFPEDIVDLEGRRWTPPTLMSRDLEHWFSIYLARYRCVDDDLIHTFHGTRLDFLALHNPSEVTHTIAILARNFANWQRSAIWSAIDDAWCEDDPSLLVDGLYRHDLVPGGDLITRIRHAAAPPRWIIVR